MNNIIIYNTDDGQASVKLYESAGTVWLAPAQIAELFDCTRPNVVAHIRTIYQNKELDKEATCKKFLQVQNEGRRSIRRNIAFYSLDVILAVGFRVKSPRGTQFRRWANSSLKEYLQKGFLLDDERLKNPDGRPDYFDELLKRIRDIRASEKRFYQKLRDLFALSSDYDKTDNATRLFFAETQNKLIFGVTGKTAADLIMDRADPSQPNMALTSWQGSRVRKEDVSIAKNYLTEDEIDSLNRLVTIFLESAEFRVKMRNDLTLTYWRDTVDTLLSDHGIPLLSGHGKHSHESMLKHGDNVYMKFDNRRRSDEAVQADRDDLIALESTVSQIKGETT